MEDIFPSIKLDFVNAKKLKQLITINYSTNKIKKNMGIGMQNFNSNLEKTEELLKYKIDQNGLTKYEISSLNKRMDLIKKYESMIIDYINNNIISEHSKNPGALAKINEIEKEINEIL